MWMVACCLQYPSTVFVSKNGCLCMYVRKACLLMRAWSGVKRGPLLPTAEDSGGRTRHSASQHEKGRQVGNRCRGCSERAFDAASKHVWDTQLCVDDAAPISTRPVIRIETLLTALFCTLHAPARILGTKESLLLPQVLPCLMLTCGIEWVDIPLHVAVALHV